MRLFQPIGGLFILIFFGFTPLQLAHSAPQKTKSPFKLKLKKPTRAFLDSEQGKITQIFNYDDSQIANPKHVMENWMTCEKNEKGVCKNANGWLTRTAEIEIVSEPISRPTFHPRAKEIIQEEYVKVRFRYPGLQGDKDGYRYGYIEKTKLTSNPNEAFFATAADEDAERDKSAKATKPEAARPNNPCGKENCALDAKNKSLIDRLKAIPEAAKEAFKSPTHLTNQSVERAVELIGPLVGKCVRKDPTQIRSEFTAKENIYMTELAPLVKGQKIPPGLNIQSKDPSKPEPMTHKHLEAIDSIARTIYAEMGSCFNKGLQYPMAVGRMILNRSTATCAMKDAVFIQGEHDPASLDITKVATTPQQFSLWLRQEGTRKNGPLLQALCPPSDEKEGYYAGKEIPEYEKEIWKNSLRIATETVMYNESFKNKTHELEARYYYTSGLGWFHGTKRVAGLKILNRPLNDHRCMEIWEDLDRDVNCNGGKMTQSQKDNPGVVVPKPKWVLEKEAKAAAKKAASKAAKKAEPKPKEVRKPAKKP